MDYSWTEKDEPHPLRGKQILEKYPEVAQLFGFDPKTKIWVIIEVFLQFLTAYFLRNQPWWLILIVAYVWGATINHSLSLAIHELSHNLLFEKPLYNTYFGFFANMPIPIAYSMYAPKK